ncbi:MAG: glycosyltransferase family A protein [Clostridium sp.]|uniref:glycosyltransferase family 2 protein n=1 Tax=Clostridium sp. TaxID=1506 RepID=UPI002FC8A068
MGSENIEPILTVFTPTYNRAYILNKCYESLKKQNNKNFKWLIIDDGSTDSTKEIVEKWKMDCDFQINYIYKENGGMHTAHNTAYENIDTEINVCIDSDDYMPSDAVDKILKAWNKSEKDNIAGIIGLDMYESGEVVGTKLPIDVKEATLFDIYNKYKVRGDKKLVYRTELTKKYKYPEFQGEKYVGLAYKYNKIDEDYKLAVVNEFFCVVEYMEDGSSRNMLKQYRNNPKGWCFYRLENLKNKNASTIYKFKECIHYVSSALMIKDKKIFKEVPYKLMIILAFPIGYLLNAYIIKKTSIK